MSVCQSGRIFVLDDGEDEGEGEGGNRIPHKIGREVTYPELDNPVRCLVKVLA